MIEGLLRQLTSAEIDLQYTDWRRPTPAITDDHLNITRARQARGESVTAIAAHLGVGRSTLYRALQPDDATAAVTEQAN